MNLEQQRAKIILESYQSNVDSELQDFLEKGKKANLGEKRNWSGKDYVKTTSGWKMSESVHEGGKKAIENLKSHASEMKKNPFKDSKVVEHEGKFYLKRGDYFQRKDGEGYVKPDPSFSFNSKEEAEKLISSGNSDSNIKKSEAYAILGVDDLAKVEEKTEELTKSQAYEILGL